MQQPWTALRLWINEQENAELRTGRPAPLTPAQRDAIDVLVPGASAASSVSVGHASPGPAPAPAPSGVVVDPDYDRVSDWVSKLYGASFIFFLSTYSSLPRRLPSSSSSPSSLLRTQSFTAPLTHSEYIQLGNHPPPVFEYTARVLAPEFKWESTCTVPGIEASFPNAEYGFLGGQAPWFSTKKVSLPPLSCSSRPVVPVSSVVDYGSRCLWRRTRSSMSPCAP